MYEQTKAAADGAYEEFERARQAFNENVRPETETRDRRGPVDPLLPSVAKWPGKKPAYVVNYKGVMT